MARTTHAINPDCAALQAELMIRLEQMVETQKKIVETVFGNGKIGLQKESVAARHDIEDIKKIIDEIAKEKRVTHEEKAAIEKEKRTAMRQFWISAALMLISTALTVGQALILIFLAPR